MEQLTFGGPEGPFHAHSYYDVPVMDAPGRRIAAHRMTFAGRHPGADDPVELGLVDAETPGSWTPLGTSRAWSWQQGPLAQWIAGGPRLCWNDREEDAFVARIADAEAKRVVQTLPWPIYAVDPAGRFGLSLNMARLNAVRPGYGYPGGGGARLDQPRPDADGVRRVELESGEARLILSLDRAVGFLRSRLGWRERARHALGRYVYWFNHAKIAPDGARFTVKLRWRRLGGPWSEAMGVSLTCGVDGDDLRLLADATSHVIWLNPTQLYFWRRGEVALFEDAAPVGRRLTRLGAGTLDDNVHIRHLPPRAAERPGRFVFDTPYRETVALALLDAATGETAEIARFGDHRPPRGPFRCDLHPCPSQDGRRIVVASLQGGGRQIHALTREDRDDGA
jgi:hypothetical protein